MNAPFGITFLRKAELYNLASRLDGEFAETKKDKKSKHPSLWPIEKAILKWTYHGHKHLGSAIKTDHLSLGDKDSKLADFGMLNKEGELKENFRALDGKVALHKPLENIVIRGFGNYFNEVKHGHTAIVINKDGLLFGETLAEIEKNDFLVKLNFFIYSKIMGHWGALALLIITTASLAILILSLIEKIKGVFK